MSISDWSSDVCSSDLDQRRVAGQRDDAGHCQRSRLFGNSVRRPSARKHARDPFPVGGVVEDPATGAAAAALGGYLRDAGLLAAPASILIRQGEAMKIGRAHV